MKVELDSKRICESCGSFYPEGCVKCKKYVYDIFLHNSKSVVTDHLRELIWFSYSHLHKEMTEDEINETCIRESWKSKIDNHLKYLENDGCFTIGDYDE